MRRGLHPEEPWPFVSPPTRSDCRTARLACGLTRRCPGEARPTSSKGSPEPAAGPGLAAIVAPPPVLSRSACAVGPSSRAAISTLRRLAAGRAATARRFGLAHGRKGSVQARSGRSHDPIAVTDDPHPVVFRARPRLLRGSESRRGRMSRGTFIRHHPQTTTTLYAAQLATRPPNTRPPRPSRVIAEPACRAVDRAALRCYS